MVSGALGSRVCADSRPSLSGQKAVVLALGRSLQAHGYQFVAPTPLTYGRVLRRSRTAVSDPLVEVFGWNRPYRQEELSRSFRNLLSEGNLNVPVGQGGMRSLIRFSTLGNMLFAHSGYPTDEPDSVFFGPDTYRFVRAVKWLSKLEPGFSPHTIIDVGAGTGAGGIFATAAFPTARHTILADINPKALDFAEINAELNETVAETRQSDVLANIEGDADLIISNPPYLIDAGERAYRHGGGSWGCALAVRIVEQALRQLASNGHFLLYTGVPVVRGTDMFMEAARPILDGRVRSFEYEEQDPDVFGEELGTPPYDQADRIAIVVLHVKGANIIR